MGKKCPRGFQTPFSPCIRSSLFHLSPFHSALTTRHASLPSHPYRSPQNFLSCLTVPLKSVQGSPTPAGRQVPKPRPGTGSWIMLPPIGSPGSQGPRGDRITEFRGGVCLPSTPSPSQEVPPGYPWQPALTAHGVEGTARLLLEALA